MTPFNDRAAEGDVKQYATFAAPTAGFVEQVFCIEPYSDSSGTTIVALVNKAKNRAVSIQYQTNALPYLTLWKNTTSIDDGYVTGIEPGTNYPYNRNLERRAGRVPKLAGKESKEIELKFTVHSNEGEVGQLKSAIDAIKANRPATSPRNPIPPSRSKPMIVYIFPCWRASSSGQTTLFWLTSNKRLTASGKQQAPRSVRAPLWELFQDRCLSPASKGRDSSTAP